MSTLPKDPRPRLAELETEVKELRHEIETLRRENAELRETNNRPKQSLDEAVIRSSTAPQPGQSDGLKPSNPQLQDTSATADSKSSSGGELRRQLNETDEQLNRTIQQLSETRKQLSDVQSRLTVNEQVTAATQRRELVQEGLYETLLTDSVYEQLRFDPKDEHVYAKLQPTHAGCNILLHFA